MKLTLKGEGHAVGADFKVDRLTLRSERFDFDRLAAYVPAFRQAQEAQEGQGPGAPKSKPMGLHGPFAIRGDVAGTSEDQSFNFVLDLGPSVIRVPDALDKPAGVPLAFGLTGKPIRDRDSVTFSLRDSDSRWPTGLFW